MKAWRDVLACATCVGVPWIKADLGFFWSALFLMVVPVAIAGLIGGWLYTLPTDVGGTASPRAARRSHL